MFKYVCYKCGLAFEDTRDELITHADMRGVCPRCNTRNRFDVADAMIERVAAEAEVGYDVDEILQRREESAVVDELLEPDV